MSWGNNHWGALGNGEYPEPGYVYSPVTVSGLTGATAISMGEDPTAGGVGLALK